MKGYIHDLILVLMGIGFGVIVYGSWQTWNYEEPEPIIITEYQVIEAEPKIITETVYVPVDTNEYLRDYLTSEDEWYLLDIGMREAGNQDVIGICWVMYTALCRAEAYGQTIKQVCESSAFESSSFSSGATPNENCLKALELIREGWIPKPLYFRAHQYHKFGTPLCQYGDHCFSMK